MQEKQRSTAACWEQNRPTRVDTHCLLWYTDCHGAQGRSRPRLGLKPNSAQQDPCPNSLEESLLSLEMTEHLFKLLQVKTLEKQAFVTG